MPRGIFSNPKERARKISVALSGRKFSKQRRYNLSLSHMGHKHSEEHKRKISEAESGEKHYNWKGGRTNSEGKDKVGYILIYQPQHPFCNKQRRVYEHRLAMEKKIGRYLKKGEIVHHINGDKTDNGIDNLHLMNNSQHSNYHYNIIKTYKKLGIKISK